MLFAIMTFYAAWRGMTWMYAWQQAELSAHWFVVTFNCCMTCIATILCLGVLYSMSVEMSVGNGFNLNINFDYELKVKE